MGYSKNYIMYWGGFYGYYNTMGHGISVHKPHKFFVFFLYILYSVKIVVFLHSIQKYTNAQSFSHIFLNLLIFPGF